MSRASAFRSIRDRDFVGHMKERGIVWDSQFADRVKDEAPMAYKDALVHVASLASDSLWAILQV